MRLESCSTVLYAMGINKERLTFEDLKFDSKYNTYQHAGLPPGPICNPGKESIKATLFPATTEYLYFVAKGDGTHLFSTNLKEHVIQKQDTKKMIKKAKNGKRKIYLDNSATTYTRREVVDAMLPYYTDIYGNASSVHKFGQDAKNALTQARKKFSELINAQSPDEIIFTSCGTESDNMAIIGVLEATKGKHIITSQLEHHAVLHTCKYLETCGYSVDYIPVNSSGIINLDILKKKLLKKQQL